MSHELRVLLVEDHPQQAAAISDALMDHLSAMVEVASTFQAAMKKLSEGDYSVVALDLRLPDSVGVNTIKGFREVYCCTPIVVVTASDDPIVAFEAGKLGVAGYWIKGGDHRDLAATVAVAAGNGHRKRALRDTALTALGG